ncbi:hypothetical protein NONO_c19050 [Nocardia nova SH22a]|uniref:Uncharacterized protein n=1 Tax=Nocardia nova SH22a TaxID=1415166 RepID=W5TBG0_9NOCA|nr:hypothetical protein [Nocardia nova]AHH16705.1 hypothetical protein NONO_c19050 [Nocardia nova SH22a]
MGKIKDAMDRLHLGRRRHAPDPEPKQLDRWANEGGALPPPPAPRDRDQH